MGFFDTHVHISPEDGAWTDYYRCAADAGVNNLLLCSSGMENSLFSANAAAGQDGVYFAAGLHPHEASEFAIHPAGDYLLFAAKTRFAAIGEIGLDYYYGFSERELQCRVFEEFLKLALQLKVPAIVHCRDKDGTFDAYEDAFSLLSAYAASGGSFVLHSFAGTPEWAEKFLSLSAWIGVGGLLTFRKADNIRSMLEIVPVERILLETDAPYLAPVPFRGKRNHPAYLPYTAQKLAELKQLSLADCRKITTANALRFLNVKGHADERI